MGRHIEAISHFTHALQLRPDSAQVHYNLGVALAGSEQPRKAIDQFEQALRLQPAYPAASRDLGLVLVRIGRQSEASRTSRKRSQRGTKAPNFSTAWASPWQAPAEPARRSSTLKRPKAQRLATLRCIAISVWHCHRRPRGRGH